MAIVRGVSENGTEMFYTGKAGAAWVSTDRSEAFDHYSIDGARNKAKQFNKMTNIHGIHFIGMYSDAEYAEHNRAYCGE